MDLIVQIFISDVLILQFCLNNVNIICAFCFTSWFLHGFYLFYLYNLLYSHKVFSYVCVILIHKSRQAPVSRSMTALSPRCYFIMSDKFQDHRCIFYTSFIFSVKSQLYKLCPFIYLPICLFPFLLLFFYISFTLASFLIYGTTIAAATINDIISATGVAQATPRIPKK